MCVTDHLDFEVVSLVIMAIAPLVNTANEKHASKSNVREL